MIKWTEDFANFLHQAIILLIIPVTCVTSGDIYVVELVPTLSTNFSHSLYRKSVEGELIARASHDQSLYWDDNYQVHYYLEELI